MPAYAEPDSLELNGEPYELFERPNGQGRKWESRQVEAQPGDVGRPKPFPLEFHGGFGFTRRYTSGAGERIGAGHHAYSENVNAHSRALFGPSPRITYVDMGAFSPSAASGPFMFGGYARSRLGSYGNRLGGGTYIETPQFIHEHGDALYVGTGSRTFTVNPATDPPVVVEVHSHGASGRARSADVFGSKMPVALGAATDVEVVTSPWTSASATVWATATGVKMEQYRTGGRGRIYSSRSNLVFNVLPGSDPATAADYVPSAGEPISDESDPVRSLEEYLGGLVAGTTQSLRTIDPDAGFQGTKLTPSTRVSTSSYAGRSLISVGSDLYYFTQRAAWLFQPGQPPRHMGLELLEQNETPYNRGVPGVPDYDGQWVYVPYYFPDTGDSVIFALHLRGPEEPGVGPVVWQDLLFLDGRECRVVRYWGGVSDESRLFFGASTTAAPESIGYVDLCDAPGSLFFRPHIGPPARSAVLYGGLDDFGTPAVKKGIDRIEVPLIQNADADNYAAVAVTTDGSTYQSLYTAAAVADPQVVAAGRAVLRPRAAAQLSGYEVGTRWTFTQAEAATEYVLVRGTPIIYLFEMPEFVEEVTTLLRLPGDAQRFFETAEAVRARLAALLASDPFVVKHAGREVYARLSGTPSLVEFADRDRDNAALYAVQIAYREIETS